MNPSTSLRLYAEMVRIRRVEEAVADAYSKQEMKCPVHLSIGQEAVPVAICAHLSDEDHVYSTHRCHAHYLAKKGNIAKMISEMHGKVTGCCKGKGGSMHLVQRETGMMGSSALVGGTIPMAVGSALAFSRERKPLVSIAFFGDGATEEGIFYESMNFAALKKLPVIFAIENNNFATYSHQKARQATLDIHTRGNTFGIASAKIDGNDVEACYQAAAEAVDRARKGQGPTVLEFTTYRWRDHVGPNFDWEIGYRTRQEVEQWMEKCPIRKLEAKLTQAGILSDDEKNRIENRLKDEIKEAFAFAKASAFPAPSEIFTDIYAQN